MARAKHIGPALAALALAVGPGLARGQDVPDAKDWLVVSPNAEYEAAQAFADGRCRLTVKRGETVAWALERCLADKQDGRFLSNDGTRLMVVHAFPSKAAGLKKATGVTLYERGEAMKRLEIGRFVVDTKPLVMATRHFYWVEGLVGQAGVPPGYSKDASGVELTTLDRRSWSVSFDGKVKKIEMPRPLGGR